MKKLLVLSILLTLALPAWSAPGAEKEFYGACFQGCSQRFPIAQVRQKYCTQTCDCATRRTKTYVRFNGTREQIIADLHNPQFKAKTQSASIACSQEVRPMMAAYFKQHPEVLAKLKQQHPAGSKAR